MNSGVVTSFYPGSDAMLWWSNISNSTKQHWMVISRIPSSLCLPSTIAWNLMDNLYKTRNIISYSKPHLKLIVDQAVCRWFICLLCLLTFTRKMTYIVYLESIYWSSGFCLVRNRNHAEYTIKEQSLFQINGIYCYS